MHLNKCSLHPPPLYTQGCMPHALSCFHLLDLRNHSKQAHYPPGQRRKQVLRGELTWHGANILLAACHSGWLSCWWYLNASWIHRFSTSSLLPSIPWKYYLYPPEVTSRLISNYILLPALRPRIVPKGAQVMGQTAISPMGENKSVKTCGKEVRRTTRRVKKVLEPPLLI